jgi:hypothetical protein
MRYGGDRSILNRGEILQARRIPPVTDPLKQIFLATKIYMDGTGVTDWVRE